MNRADGGDKFLNSALQALSIPRYRPCSTADNASRRSGKLLHSIRGLQRGLHGVAAVVNPAQDFADSGVGGTADNSAAEHLLHQQRGPAVVPDEFTDPRTLFVARRATRLNWPRSARSALVNSTFISSGACSLRPATRQSIPDETSLKDR